MTIYPLTEHDERRVRECTEALTARIPEAERWLMLAGADRFGLTTGIELDLSDPTDVCVMWLGRTIFTVPRQALAGSEPLDDHIQPPRPPDQADSRG